MLFGMKELLGGGWDKLLKNEVKKPYFKKLLAFVENERALGPVFPPEQAVFSAFEACPFDRVKCVILGQDPYHGEGQATGLAFSVTKGCKIPPSLRNIYKELESDLKIAPPEHGDLSGWASQGVLLLNTTLTVRKKSPLSHAGQGWETFTTAVLSELIQLERPLVFVLWGTAAKAKYDEAAGDQNKPFHLVLKSAHPSPFSAKAFFGTKPFSQLNNFLKIHHISPVNFIISS